jgi:hypothetical protein
VSTAGGRLDFSVPKHLFTMPAHGPGYEPAPDGQRFLVNLTLSDPSPISVILNWKPPPVSATSVRR